MDMELDGRKVEVGDKLYSIIYGWGIVKSVNSYKISKYCFIEFENGACGNFNSDGKSSNQQNRVIFWDEVVITPPLPPKKPVKKWKWVIESYAGMLAVSMFHFVDEDEYRQRGYPASNRFIQKIESTEKEFME